MVSDEIKCQYGATFCEGTGGSAGHQCYECTDELNRNRIIDLGRKREERLPRISTNLDQAMISCATFIEGMASMGHPQFCAAFAVNGKRYTLTLECEEEQTDGSA